MEYLAYAAVLWVGLAFTFWMLLFVMENLLAVLRVPEYIKAVTKAMERAEREEKPSLAAQILHWLWSWPITFYHWIQAVRQGKTLMEYAKDHNDMVDEFRQSFVTSMTRADFKLSQALGEGDPNRVWLPLRVSHAGR